MAWVSPGPNTVNSTRPHMVGGDFWIMELILCMNRTSKFQNAYLFTKIMLKFLCNRFSSYILRNLTMIPWCLATNLIMSVVFFNHTLNTTKTAGNLVTIVEKEIKLSWIAVTTHVLISELTILHNGLCIKMKELLAPVTESHDVLLEKHNYFSAKQELASQCYRWSCWPGIISALRI